MDDEPPTTADEDPQYDLDFRPVTYWPGRWDNRHKLSRISGTVRRGVADLLHDSQGEAIPDDPIFEPALSRDAREALSSVHPAFMGGEFLPEFEDDEVQIARLEYFLTVTCDVVVVLARPTETGISYRIVDEYMDAVKNPESRFVCSPSESEVPLTLGELIALLEDADDHAMTAHTTKFVLDYFLRQDLPVEEWGGIIADSDFYPGIHLAFNDMVKRLAARYLKDEQ